ncbi:MAG: DNA replication/repair protein RecF [Christensenellaceae bacterium]
MYLKKIKLLNFRNYEQLNIDGFSERINIFYGANAQGKTNLLEAIHICANGKSFRINADSKTIKFNTAGAYLSVEFFKDGQVNSIEVIIEKDKKKSIKINGIPAKNLKELLGNLFVIVFSPEDLKTVKESPALRRAFIDAEISKIRPSYVDALKKYTKIIAEKNAALRKRNQPNTREIIEAYNEQLEGIIKMILKNRIAYIKKLNEMVSQTHNKLSGGKEKIKIAYKSTINVDNIKETLQKLVQKELDEFGCTAGPHRDDIDFTINDKDARVYASQGQLRTLMLAVKTACLKILEQNTGQTPILLLDDVFSELDPARKQNLLDYLKEFQVFITTADLKELKQTNGAEKFEVIGGTIRHCKKD